MAVRPAPPPSGRLGIEDSRPQVLVKQWENGAELDARIVQIFDRMDGTDGVREKAAARHVAQLFGRRDVKCKFKRSAEQGARRTEARRGFVERLTGVPSAETAAWT